MGALLACRGGWRSIAGTEVPAQGAGSGGAYSIPGVPDSKPPNFHRVGQNQGSYEEVQRFVYMGEGQGRFHANDLERQGARDESPSGPSRIDLARLFYVFIMVFFVLAGVICVGISLTSEHSHEDRSMAAATDGPLVASEDAAQATAVASAPVVAASTAAESTLAPTYAGYGVPQTEITNGDAADDCVQSQGVAWSKEQSVRCCAEKGVGCPELDCDAGLSHWEKEWSEGKKEWCCSQGSSAGCGGDGGRQAVFRFVGFGDAREARRACKYSAGVAMPKSQGEVDEFKRMLDEEHSVAWRLLGLRVQEVAMGRWHGHRQTLGSKEPLGPPREERHASEARQEGAGALAVHRGDERAVARGAVAGLARPPRVWHSLPRVVGGHHDENNGDNHIGDRCVLDDWDPCDEAEALRLQAVPVALEARVDGREEGLLLQDGGSWLHF